MFHAELNGMHHREQIRDEIARAEIAPAKPRKLSAHRLVPVAVLLFACTLVLFGLSLPLVVNLP